MIYLIFAIFTSSAIIVVFKLFNKFSINNIQAITANYFIASLLGFFTVPYKYQAETIISADWLLLSLLAGISLIVVFNIFALSSQKAGVAITAISGKMSVVIPVSIGIIFYHDAVNFWIIAGIIASLLAFYLSFKKKEQLDVRKLSYLLPMLVFIGNGTNDSLLKHSEKFFIGGDTALFLSVAFLFSFIIGTLILLIDMVKNKSTLRVKHFIAGLILGLLNYASTYFFLKALSYYPNTIFFPLFNVSIVVIAAITAFFIFREKLTTINWLGIILALAAILMITLA